MCHLAGWLSCLRSTTSGINPPESRNHGVSQMYTKPFISGKCLIVRAHGFASPSNTIHPSDHISGGLIPFADTPIMIQQFTYLFIHYLLVTTNHATVHESVWRVCLCTRTHISSFNRNWFMCNLNKLANCNLVVGRWKPAAMGEFETILHDVQNSMELVLHAPLLTVTV